MFKNKQNSSMVFEVAPLWEGVSKQKQKYGGVRATRADHALTFFFGILHIK